MRLCTPSRTERIQRGATYRNIYLTGDDGGAPQTYNKTFSYLDNLCSYLYSPVELRFRIEKYGAETLIDRAKFRAAAAEMQRHMRNANVDTIIAEAVNWSLIKGKAFIKMGWGQDGFEPLVVQPEFMGVLEENLPTLDKQEAFVHTTYVTPTRFQLMVMHHPERDAVMRDVAKYIGANHGQVSPLTNNMLREVVVGGLNPYRAAGSSNASNARGVVNWLTGPNPTFAPELLAKLIQIDELWVQDSDRNEWTTIQIVGDDILLTPQTQHRNLFADAFDPDNTERRLQRSEANPLAGHQPFLEFCANPLDGYFWGMSELHHVALLQESLNKRIDGINRMLRMQEKPPQFFSGTSAINQQILSRLNKPDGWLADSNPNAKVQSLAPEIPKDIWESLQQIEQMFDQVGGFAPVLQGRGESGVRAQGHAETLVRTASPRFKDRALAIERQVEELGGLCLDMLKAKWEKSLVAWTPPGARSIEALVPPDNTLEEPPIPGSKPVEFLFHQLPECKVSVDSHSSSPAFSEEGRQLAFSLAKAGAVSPEQLVELTHPPHESSIIADIERRQQQQAEMVREHPELAVHHGGKAGRPKGS